MRVAVICPYEISRKGLCSLISGSSPCTVVADLPAVPEDMDQLRKARPDVLVIHVNGFFADFGVVAALREDVPEVKILLLMDEADEQVEMAAIRAGANGCVARTATPCTLLNAIDAIARDEIWATPHAMAQLIGQLRHTDKGSDTTPTVLTPREWEIMALLAGGARNKEVANSLGISESTVKTHLLTIYRKLNVDSRLAATLYYFEHAKSRNEVARNTPLASGKRNAISNDRSDHLAQKA